jgi:hypothetical protein
MASSDEEGSVRTDQAESEESEGDAPGVSRSGSEYSERSRSKSRDPDVSAAPLEEDSSDAGVMSELTIEAVMKLDTYEDIDEVNEIDFVDVVEESYDLLTEVDPDEILDVEDVAGEVVFPSNSSLPPPRVHLVAAERIEEQPDLEMVIIPVKLETKEADVPAEEPCCFEDSRASCHVPVRSEELVDVSLKSCRSCLRRQIPLRAGSIWMPVVGIHLIAVWLTNLKRAVSGSRRECWIQGERCRPSVL